jgi:glycosyltransferase involved in cell wall biosynthesis
MSALSLVPRVSVVIPAKNEARNIGWVLERMPDFVDEVIIVDGLSSDGTLEVARMIAPDVIVIHEMRRGKGAAMRAGMDVARGEYIVLLDADGSMDPQEIERYVEQLDAGFDMVKGSRKLPGGGSTDITWTRDFGNARLRDLANLLFGTNFTELCYGFVGLRRDVVPLLALDADGFEIETQMVTRAVRAGLRIAEVPSVELPRRYGESNLNTFRDGWRVLSTIFSERLARGAPLVTPTAVPISVAVPVASGESELTAARDDSS